MTEQEKLSEYAQKLEKNGRHAFFLDIDGTMVMPLDQRGVSQRLKNAIARGQEKGHLFFVNTGRAIGYVSQTLLDSASFDGTVSGMGAHIVYHGETIYRSVVPFDVIKEVADYCDKNGESIIFEGESDGREDGGRYALGDSGFFNVKYTFTDKEEFLREISGKTMLKMTLSYVPCEEYVKFLSKYFDVANVPPIYAEGALIGHDKGKAIRKTCDVLGIPYENTVAVGDSENDRAMLLSAGISCAMGNANQEVKEICDIVCDHIRNDGCAALIEALVG
jgi:Cof subfamily protein (haloacid dehalogenase superfamily)